MPLAAQTASPADPLQSRVTIDYRESPAANVIGDLAAAAGLKVEIGSGTNVLNFLCAMHNCQWDFDGVRGLRVTRKR